MFKFLEENKIYVYILFALYWLTLLAATSFPARHVPDVAISDKFKHFFAYFGFSLLFNIVLYIQNKFRLFKSRSSLFTLIFVLLYGIIDEIHQYFIPGRTCELMDWVADALGAVTGITVFIFILKKNLTFPGETQKNY